MGSPIGGSGELIYHHGPLTLEAIGWDFIILDSTDVPPDVITHAMPRDIIAAYLLFSSERMVRLIRRTYVFRTSRQPLPPELMGQRQEGRNLTPGLDEYLLWLQHFRPGHYRDLLKAASHWAREQCATAAVVQPDPPPDQGTAPSTSGGS